MGKTSHIVAFAVGLLWGCGSSGGEGGDLSDLDAVAPDAPATGQPVDSEPRDLRVAADVRVSSDMRERPDALSDALADGTRASDVGPSDVLILDAHPERDAHPENDGLAPADSRVTSDLTISRDVGSPMDGPRVSDVGSSDVPLSDAARPEGDGAAPVDWSSPGDLPAVHDLGAPSDLAPAADQRVVADSLDMPDAAGGLCQGADLRRDPNNCGTCGVECAAGVPCLRGFCGRQALLRAVLPALRLLAQE